MNLYTLGFAFNHGASKVVLIRKNRPAWQAGKLNGVGGKIEVGETDVACMVREFREETGVSTTESDWHLYAELHGNYAIGPFRMAVFRMFNNAALQAVSPNDETIEIHDITSPIWRQQGMSNLPWLIAAALDPDSDRLMLKGEYRDAA